MALVIQLKNCHTKGYIDLKRRFEWLSLVKTVQAIQATQTV